MKRYPDDITITQHPEPEQDKNGNFITPEGVVTFTTECRFEPATGNNTVKGDDGSEIIYSYKVYMPSTNNHFEFGDNISGTTHSGFSITGKVKRQFNRQKHTEIWV